MKKTAILAAIIITVLVAGCGANQSQAPQTEEVKVEAPQTEAVQAETAKSETEAAKSETEAAKEEPAVTIDRFIGKWGEERAAFTVEKTGDNTVNVTYHGLFSAREGREGSGKGELKDGTLYVDMEYENYMYPSGGGEPARIVIGKSTEEFKPAEAMPDDYECFEGEAFYANLNANLTTDKLEVYLKADCDKPEDYLHIKSELINLNGLASEYMVWYSDQIELTEEEISWMNKEEINNAKNEIYARHGMKFNSKDTQEFFNGRSWYAGTIEEDNFDDSVLSDIEKANVKLFEEAEKKMK